MRHDRRSLEPVPWWAWCLIAVGGVALVCGWGFRSQLRFTVKLTKALATDERLPRPLRWAVGIALAVKVIPVPDFGIDEVILALVAALLLTVYRHTFHEIVAETRGVEAENGTTRVPAE